MSWLADWQRDAQLATLERRVALLEREVRLARFWGLLERVAVVVVLVVAL